MKINLKGSIRSVSIVSVALILGVSAGVAVTGITSSASPPNPNFQCSSPYPTNASGQTYGCALGTNTPPDLVRTYADNGEVGYVLASQLIAASGGNVQNPQEALAWDAIANQSRVIPVYSENGTTVIGSFTIESGTSSSTTLSSGK